MLSPTYFGLLAEFRAAEIPLEDCCEKYLRMTAPQAKRKAALNELPFPVYRGARSRKAAWFVDAVKLSEWLDAMKREAEESHRNVNSEINLSRLSA